MTRPPSRLPPDDYTKGVREQLTAEAAQWIMARADTAVRAIREAGSDGLRLPEPETLEIIRAALVDAYKRGRKPMRRR